MGMLQCESVGGECESRCNSLDICVTMRVGILECKGAGV